MNLSIILWRFSRYVGVALGVLLLWLAPTVAHAQDGDSALSVMIEWPNEGETFYAGPSSLLYKVPIKGRVESETHEPDEIAVQLDVFHGDELIGTLLHDLDEGGGFEFQVTVNPHGSTEQFTIGFYDCGLLCHSEGEMPLRPGHLRLLVTATARDGAEASATRQVTVDVAQTATVPVDVVLDGEQVAVADVTVSAATRVYLWRARFGSGLSDSEGRAEVAVEALSQAPTEYVFRVEPTVVDGVLYEGLAPETVRLPPGAESAPPITLAVTSRRGSIAGSLSSAAVVPGGTEVWAIRLPDGAAFRTEINEEGRFQFSDLPVDEYLVTLDHAALLQSGWQSPPHTLDLAQELEAEATLALAQLPGVPLQGVIRDESGLPLPFAWVDVRDSGATAATTPDDGRFTLGGLQREPTTVTFQAPGHYARAQVVEAQSGEAHSVALVRKPDTRALAWGQGEVVVPVESEATLEGQTVILEQGWLWGEGGDAPLQLETPVATMAVDEGRFALEYLPGRHAWFYLFEGAAELRSPSGGEAIALQGGQMVNLYNGEGLRVVSYEPAVVHALHGRQASPLPVAWEPTMSARVRDGLARLGIGAAQVVTFVTYLLVILSLLSLPLLPLYLTRRRRRASQQRSQTEA
ncbi:MAG TPA: carboxypeptidase regulatory-like domain-containing protein [Candidatus Sulfomarinibacteraceae bacterium]|nr:carboxypeptidase regulatory-like domain-containing protein [Candidatus Sulfomarinibacteraceae bacterium]